MPEKVNETMTENLFTEHAFFDGQEKHTATQLALRLRNTFVVLAAVLFLASFPMTAYPALRAAGYLFGALAYICEILVLTDCFRVKLSSNEMFMPYCFGPLYVIMGIGYLVC